MTLLRSGLSVPSPAELFEGGFEVFDDFLGQNIGIWEVVGFFEAFISEPEDVGAGFITLMVPLISKIFSDANYFQ